MVDELSKGGRRDLEKKWPAKETKKEQLERQEDTQKRVMAQTQRRVAILENSW